MDKEREKELKEELNKSFTDEYIRNAGMLIHKLAEQFFEENRLEGKIYFNDDIFYYCLIDILVDLARLKYFHDISSCEEDYIYVNERFALTLLLQAGNCFDKNVNYYEEDQKDLIKGIGQIYYHLKYRNTNPQTLELFLTGLEIGRKIRQINIFE